MPSISEREALVLSGIDARSGAMASTVVEWAEINSGSRNPAGLTAMAERLHARLIPLADSVEVRPPDPVTAFDDRGRSIVLAHGENLLARKRVHAGRRVILTGHMDTVFAVDHPFQQCRMLEPGVLGGPGTADMKGGLVIMLEALDALERAGALDAIGWDIVINADEEVSSLGSASLLREVARGCRVGLTFEPSMTPDGGLAGARKGSGNFCARLRGRSAHAGRNPQDGRNAVIAAADLALRLNAWARQDGDVTVNVSRMAGGGAGNIVPDLALLWWNMRPADRAAQARAAQAIDALVTEIRRVHEVEVEMEGAFSRPPKPMDARHQALFAFVRDTGADLGLTLGWQSTGGVCDGNNIAAEGVAVIDTLGARGGAIHTPGEYLLLESLTERAHLTALILMRLAEGRLDGAIGW